MRPARAQIDVRENTHEVVPLPAPSSQQHKPLTGWGGMPISVPLGGQFKEGVIVSRTINDTHMCPIIFLV
jgi:hypothetical protein